MSGADNMAGGCVNDPGAETVVDVVVVGSGCGGMSAALTAHHLGLSVLLVEKSSFIGGTTAISGGAMWLPGTDAARAAGLQDTRSSVSDYLAATVGESGSLETRSAFLDAVAPALRDLESFTELKTVLRKVGGDYYLDKQGASLGGRTVDTAEFDGRLLGRKHFRELRSPLDEFMVLRGMMVTLPDVWHLLAAHRSIRSLRHAGGLLMRYGRDRLAGYHRGTRLVLGNALAARLFYSVLKQGIPYWLESHVSDLLVDEVQGSHAVCGVRVTRQGRETRVHARRGVVLASGGFSWNEALRSRHYPAPAYAHSMMPNTNSGDGVAMALRAGASLGRSATDAALWTPVSLRVGKNGSRQIYPHLIWDRAKPGLIAVNRLGQRFVNEATTYHEFVRAMYRHARTDSADVSAFLICDSMFIRRWGLGLALPGGRPHGHLVRCGYLFRATSLATLAGQLGIDSLGLEATVARFNAHARNGSDPDFHKGASAYDRNLGDPAHRPNPCLGEVLHAPFFALRIYPGDLGTMLGIATDADARALDPQGSAIPGLYAVGNDMHALTGGQYPAPGTALGPALVFGWRAAQHLARIISSSPTRPPRHCVDEDLA